MISTEFHFLRVFSRISGLFLLLWFSPIWGMGQGDSLLQQAERAFADGEPMKALSLLEDAQYHYAESGNDSGLLQTSLRSGYVALSMQDTKKALAYYHVAKEQAKKSHRNSDYQEAIDAIATIQFYSGDLEAAIPLLQEGRRMALKNKDQQHFSSLAVQLGFAYFQLGRLDSAHFLLQEGLAIKQSIGDSIGEALALNYLGLYYHALGDYERTQDYYLKTLELRRAQGNLASVALMLKNLSSLFMDIKNWERAEDYAQQAIALAEQQGLTIYRAEALGNLADINVRNGRVQLALEQYLEITELYRRSGNKLRLIDNLLRLGQIYLDQGHSEHAEALMEEALDLAEDSGDRQSLIKVWLQQGRFDLEEGQAASALPNLQKAADLAESSGLPPLDQQASRLLVLAYSSLEMYQEAFHWQKRYTSLQDRIYQEDQQKAIYELETRYQLKGKEQEIDILNTQNELANLQLHQARRKQWGLSMGLLSLSAVVMLIFFMYRIKQRSNQQLAEKNAIIHQALQDKELLLKEIHHRVKNNLQVVSSLLKLQSVHLSDKQAQTALEEVRQRVHSMALIHRNLYQGTDLASLDARAYVPQLTEALFVAYNKQPEQIRLHTQIEPLRINLDTAIPLGLILNELMANALKYAFAEGETGSMQVALFQEDGTLHLSVEDDGVGMERREDNKHAGRLSFGWQLIELLAEKLQASVSVETTSGTLIHLAIKNYHLV